MKRKRYYGVAGTNGYGVYGDYDNVLISKLFITSFTMKALGVSSIAVHLQSPVSIS